MTLRPLLCALVLLTAGCATTVETVTLAHHPLARMEPQRRGLIVLEPLADARTEKHAKQDPDVLGVSTNMVGYVWTKYVVGNERGCTEVMTRSVGRALEAAGYQVVAPGGAKGREPLAVIRGRVDTVWIYVGSTVIDVGLHLEAVDPASGELLWKQAFHRTSPLHFSKAFFDGVTPKDYQTMMTDLLTDFFGDLAGAFAGEDFYGALAPGTVGKP